MYFTGLRKQVEKREKKVTIGYVSERIKYSRKCIIFSFPNKWLFILKTMLHTENFIVKGRIRCTIVPLITDDDTILETINFWQ